MSEQDKPFLALDGFRALDLTDEKGPFCGKILADLGVEVIKVESPGGDPSRWMPPFYQSIADPEKSLFFFANNANKKSITLDLTQPDGQQIFKRLARTSDFVIESFQPGFLTELGLDYASLSDINPRIILTSITAFGQEGPYSRYAVSNILCTAMSGYMHLTGDADRAPVGMSFPHAYAVGSAEAAVATLIAHYYRERTGEGQHVDVALRDVMINQVPQATNFWEAEKKILKRSGPFRTGLSTTAQQRTVWRCQDGWVSFVVFGATFGARSNRRLVEWMAAENRSTEFLNGWQWEDFDMAQSTQEQHDQIEKALADFFAAHTREELCQGAIARGIMLHPINTVEDIAKSEQLRVRGFWEQVDYPDLNLTLTYPGAFIKATATPCVPPTRAPHIGEHNALIYSELGISTEELANLEKNNVI